MRTQSELDFIKRVVDNSYNRWGNLLMVNTEKPFNPQNPELGYCFKYLSEDGKVIYKIVCSEIGIPRTDFRTLMHEYGHIYLAHMDGIHEELDTQICNVFRDHRGELIDRINQECGIDFADKLIERVIDDPILNHSLHNIAMDMEVNSKVLSTEDVEEMEKDVTSVLPKYEEELLKYKRDHTSDENLKKEIDDLLKKMENETKIKLIVPERYHLGPELDENGNQIPLTDPTTGAKVIDATTGLPLVKQKPFPSQLSYPEYLILIVKHLDQFVKMLVNIQAGGNGDTSQVSQGQVKDALSKGASSLDDLMQSMGMSDNGGQPSSESQQCSGNDQQGSEKTDSPYKGTRSDGCNDLNGDKSQDGGTHKDHGSDSRKEADQKRELGEIKSGGGTGCGKSGGPDATRIVSKDVDDVDMALDEVLRNFKSKVVKFDVKKDVMRLYNRGVVRSVIAPSITRNATISTDPSITFLIDISGSMDTGLIDRILKTISKELRKLNRGLKYNIITWSTRLGEDIRGIDPRKGVPRISYGGGTRIAEGIKYFKENFKEDSILIIISDFEDYLEEWAKVESSMPRYTMYAFNYGRNNYKMPKFKHLKVRHFSRQNNRYGY